jgi:ParB-like chromosome segregation protein Spo0J
LIDDKNEIVAGHGRHLAAQRLGMKVVPCVRSRNLTPEQVRAFRIADNKVAESEWDTEALLLEINELMEQGVEIDAMGYDEAEVEAMIDEFGKPEKVSRQAAKPQRKKGKKDKPGQSIKKYRIMVECRTGKQKDAFLERFQGEGVKCWPV